jgi:hypothetical protein
MDEDRNLSHLFWMDHHMRSVLFVLGAQLLMMPAAIGGVLNGGFESGDASGWTSTGSVTVKETNSYAYHDQDVGSVSADEGTFAAELFTGGVDEATLAAALNVSVNELRASNLDTKVSDGSLLSQTFSASAGQTVSFRWNFVELDYSSWNDWSFYGISRNGGPATLTRLSSVRELGPLDDGTISGWQSVSFRLDQSGSYTLSFGVVNALDEAFNSYLWVDDVQLTAVPEPTTMALVAVGLTASFCRVRWNRNRRK